MSVSGRAGLFTMDDGRFFGDLRGMPYTANGRQKSGALRLEFGQLTLAVGTTSATIRTTINTGIVSFVSTSKLPVAVGAGTTASGYFNVATPGNFVSGIMDIRAIATGEFSGNLSGLAVNYLCIGY